MNPRKILPFFVLLLFFAQVNFGYGQEPWQECRSRHFIIYYRSSSPEDFIKSVQDTAERFYGEISSSLGFSRFLSKNSGQQIAIYIYRDQEDYMASSKQEGWSHGVAYFRQREIRTFPAAYGFFDSVLPHELGHLVFRDFVGDNASIPLWLDEGVAMFQEKAKRWGAHKIVKRAMVGNGFIPLEELSRVRLGRESSREFVDLFYAESASVVYYMITDLGPQRFVQFCRMLKDGNSFTESLPRVYGRFRDVTGLERAWRNYLERQ